MPEIHAAANRIPVLRTDSQLRDLPELSDNQPTPLDHHRPHTWSGSIRFSITAKTPLVYGNVDDQTRAISIPTTTLTKAGTTPHEIPILPTTMVKGMLSNAFERVTTSRLRIFEARPEPLTYRMDPAASQRLIPTLVDPQNKTAKLLTGTHPRLETTDDIRPRKTKQPRTQESGDQKKSKPIIMAAALPTRPGKKTRFAPGMTNKELLDLIQPQQGMPYIEICFDAKLVDNGTYAYWFIYALYKDDKEHTRVPIFDEHSLTGKDLEETLSNQRGYIYLTTDPEDLRQHRRIFKNKTSERVFFSEDLGKQDTATIPEGTDEHLSPIDRYFLTIQSYADNWDEELKLTPKTKRTPNRFIRQYQAITSDRTEQFLAYSLIRKGLSTEKIIDTLVPISVGRNTYTTSPFTVATQSHVAPASDISEFSPADRLFGHVTQVEESPLKDTSPVSFKGRISIVDAHYSDGKGVRYSTLRLRPLLSPRPSSARRFLTRIDGSNLNSDEHKVRRDQYFSHDPEQSLGATTYPVDRNAWEKVDKKTKFPKKALRTASDSLNVTSEVKSYVEAGTAFDVTMHFEALTEFELAWLLWILEPANLVPQNEPKSNVSINPSEKIGYLRLGTGKPLGLGVVQVELCTNGFEASKTSDSNMKTPSLCSAYAQLTGCLGTVVTTTDPTQFQLPKHYLKTRWVEAFQRSCFGYDDKLDVRHFTLEENRENNLTEPETRLPFDGTGVEPGTLWGLDSDAPISTPKRQRDTRGR